MELKFDYMYTNTIVFLSTTLEIILDMNPQYEAPILKITRGEGGGRERGMG